MRRTIFAVALLLITAVPAFAVSRTVMVVDDVIRMSKAGVGDEEIIAFVKKTRQPFQVNGDDVIAMQDAHVSQAVMRVVIDESAATMRDDRARDDRRDGYTHHYVARDDDGYNTRTVVYVSPGIYSPWYDPFYYGYGYYPYYPYYYGPGVSIGFGFGWGGYRGGFYRGGGHFGGGHTGGGGHHGRH